MAALYTALVKPGVFGRLLIESPSLYVRRGHLLRMARAAKRWPARVYLGVGTMETRRQDWNEETVRYVLLLERALRRARLGPRRLRVRVEEGAAHTESAWAARLPDALEFLFGGEMRKLQRQLPVHWSQFQGKPLGISPPYATPIQNDAIVIASVRMRWKLQTSSK